MNTLDTNRPAEIATNEDRVVHAILQRLDAQASSYSVATQMRLNEARARAIAATRAKVPFWRTKSILAATFAVSAAFSFVVLTQQHSVRTSAEMEATALYEATFGADDETLNPAEYFDSDLDATALNEMGLDETGLDETVLANDLEFYAWLSESTNTERAPAGSGS